LKAIIDAGFIEKPLFSFYISRNAAVESSIKFGGFDSSAIEDGHKLTWVKSVSDDSVKLRAYDVVIGDSGVRQVLSERTLVFEPQVPFMYAPKDDFKSFLNVAVREYSGIQCSNRHKGSCHFEMPCNEVSPSDKAKKLRIILGTQD